MAWLGFGSRLLTCLLCCGVVAGCGGGATSGSVSGTAIYNDKPLTSGTINFISKSGSAGVGTLDTAGAYKIDGQLDVGEYKVYYGAAPPEPMAPGSKAPPKPKADLPAKFKKPETTTVSVTVTGGTNVIPVVFKD